MRPLILTSRHRLPHPAASALARVGAEKRKRPIIAKMEQLRAECGLGEWR